MVVAGTAQIGVVEERGRTAVLGGSGVAFAGEEGGDALAIEDAQFDGARRHRFDADRIEAATRAQNAKAGAEPCSGCGRLASTALIKPSVFGPILLAQRRNRSGVHSA